MGLGLVFTLIGLSGRNKEETLASILSVLGYAVISHSDHRCSGSVVPMGRKFFSGLQLIISSAVRESKTQAVSFLN